MKIIINLNTKKTVKSIVYYISKLYYYCYSIYMYMYYLVTCVCNKIAVKNHACNKKYNTNKDKYISGYFLPEINLG